LTLQLNDDFVVLDDLDGRASAIDLELPVIGSLGLLVRAKGGGLIEEVRPLMDAMISHRFYTKEDLCRRILVIAGENT
jgi:predicted nucleic acid-binding protein